MAGALGILLKSMGVQLDPEQLTADYAQVKKDIATWGATILDLKRQMDRIEALLISAQPPKQDDENGRQDFNERKN